MSIPKVMKTWRIWCLTEQKYYTVDSIDSPTVCPTDPSHILDHTKEMILECDTRIVTVSGNERFQTTTRKPGLKWCWMGEGDSQTAYNKVGGGTKLALKHTIGQSINPIYMDLNIVENETYITEGYLSYDNGSALDGIRADFSVVPKVVTVEPASNTYFNVYGGYLVVPAAGDGTVNITSDITAWNGGLVEVPINEKGYRSFHGYWNAEWDTVNKVYKNLSAAPLGDGIYNMYCYEVVFSKFHIGDIFCGKGSIRFNCSDIENLTQGMRIKIVLSNWVDDHDWVFSAIAAFHRSILYET